MTNNIFTFKIGGQGGQGQQVAGLIFTKALVRGGYFAFDYSEYPSRIRGGHVTYQVSVCKEPIYAAYKIVDLLVALTKETIEWHLEKLSKDALILYDSDKIKLEKDNLKDFKLYPLPLESLTKQVEVKPLAENMIAIGAVMALINYDLKILNQVITDVFLDKGKEIIEMNIKAAEFGYNYAKKNFTPQNFPYNLKFQKLTKDRIVLTSNEAVALSAIASGCQLYAAYPMTPATSILHYLAAWAEKTKMIVRQPEDEISAIHLAIGASFAGIRAMTGTSGGGFALTTEALALAGMTETPLVILESQRPGPATGLPTWTEQGDLKYLATVGHGEFPRVILAPGNTEEAFYLTSLAFNLAEIYQIPVFILLDKYLSEGHQSVLDFDLNQIEIKRGEILTEKDLKKMKEYKRYQLTNSGVSPRTLAGQKGGVHLANSDEHDEFGFSIEGYQAEMRRKQVEKRLAKLQNILKDLPEPQIFGPKEAEITLIGWGSVKGPILEALKYLPKINYIHVLAPFPLSEEKIREITKKAKYLVCIENNATGQFASILKEQGEIEVSAQLNKYDGRPFFPEEIVEQVNKLKN